jgi:hypothetical protein
MLTYCVGLSEDWQQIKGESFKNQGGIFFLELWRNAVFGVARSEIRVAGQKRTHRKGAARNPQLQSLTDKLNSELQNAPVCFLRGPFRCGLYRRGFPCRS